MRKKIVSIASFSVTGPCQGVSIFLTTFHQIFIHIYTISLNSLLQAEQSQLSAFPRMTDASVP